MQTKNGKHVCAIKFLPRPIVFVTTDLINEYFGEKGERKLSYITAALITYCFFVLYFAMQIPAAGGGVDDKSFTAVVGQSMWIIVGSITAFLISQLIDAAIFYYLKSKTGTKMIWLRSTGSTVISQLVESFIVLGMPSG